MAAEGSIREASLPIGSFASIREDSTDLLASASSFLPTLCAICNSYRAGFIPDSHSVKARPRLGIPRAVEKATAFSISGDTDYAGRFIVVAGIPRRPLHPREYPRSSTLVDLSVGSLTAKSRHFRDHDPVVSPLSALDTPEELSERTAAETRENERTMCNGTEKHSRVYARRILIRREDCANASIRIESMLETLPNQSRDAIRDGDDVVKKKKKHAMDEDSMYLMRG